MYRVLVLCALVLGVLAIPDPESLVRRLDELETRVKASEDNAGEVKVFFQRDVCPSGYRVLHEVDGRFIMAGHKIVGQMHGGESLHEAPRRNFTMPCKSALRVNEAGGERICHGGADGALEMSLDVKEMLPTANFLFCIKENPVFLNNQKYAALAKN